MRGARQRQLPVLGICRGIQLVNVAFGGTLLQHLPDVTDVEHEALERWDATAHPIEIEPGSRLSRILATERMEVNSVHHQALDRIGEGLRVVARALDGVVEAVESPDEAVLAVQWHPEWSRNIDWERQRRLFEALVVR